ncbi:MAG TPA: hypothetical protein VFM46_05110, partial [Pseudomonadales bacterium]|nr:hypothetical protein [Pseudomonadales bacterium]
MFTNSFKQGAIAASVILLTACGGGGGGGGSSNNSNDRSTEAADTAYRNAKPVVFTKENAKPSTVSAGNLTA